MSILSTLESVATGDTISTSLKDRVYTAAPDGTQWIAAVDGTVLAFWYKKSGGAWTKAATTRTLWTSNVLKIDGNGRIHLASADARKYVAGTPNGAGTDWVWGTDVALTSSSQYRLEDMAIGPNGSNSTIHLIWSRYYTTSSTTYCTEERWTTTWAYGGSKTYVDGHCHAHLPTNSTSGWLPDGSGCPYGHLTHSHSMSDCHDYGTDQQHGGGDDLYFAQTFSHTHNLNACTRETRTVACGTSTSYYSYVYHQFVDWNGTGTPVFSAMSQIGGNYSSSGHSQCFIIHKMGTNECEAVYRRSNGYTYARMLSAAGAAPERPLGYVQTGTTSSLLFDSVVWDGSNFVISYHSGSTVTVIEKAGTGTGTGTVLLSNATFGESIVETSLAHSQTVTALVARGATLLKNKVKVATGAFSNWATYSLTGTPANLSLKEGLAGFSLAGAVTDGGNLKRLDAYRFQTVPSTPTPLSPILTRASGTINFSVLHTDLDNDPPHEIALKINDGTSDYWWNGTSFVGSETYISAVAIRTGNQVDVPIPDSTFPARRVTWSASTKDEFNAAGSAYSAGSPVLVAPPNEGWGSVDAGHERF